MNPIFAIKLCPSVTQCGPDFPLVPIRTSHLTSFAHNLTISKMAKSSKKAAKKPPRRRGRYNSGHWNPAETRLLLTGLNRYGRDWVALSDYVGSR